MKESQRMRRRKLTNKENRERQKDYGRKIMRNKKKVKGNFKETRE